MLGFALQSYQEVMTTATDFPFLVPVVEGDWRLQKAQAAVLDAFPGCTATGSTFVRAAGESLILVPAYYGVAHVPPASVYVGSPCLVLYCRGFGSMVPVRMRLVYIWTAWVRRLGKAHAVP